jgi:lipopolysaccharide assembly protein A
VRIVSLIFTLLLIAVGVVFAALNAKPVEINYLVGARELPLVVILLAFLTLGILLSIIVMGISILKLKTKNKWLESKLKKANEQLTQVPH